MNTEFKKGSGNVYKDLGFPDAEKMQIKASLVSEIDDEIKKRKLTQQQAAVLIGLSQPKLSQLLKGHFRGVSEFKLLECLTKLGKDVEIFVHSNRKKQKTTGTVKVCFEHFSPV